MAKSITITKTNTKKKTKMNATAYQPISVLGKFINPNNLRFVDKYGVVHTNREACWEANRA